MLYQSLLIIAPQLWSKKFKAEWGDLIIIDLPSIALIKPSFSAFAVTLLVSSAKAESEGIVKAIDGRPIKIRSPHSALNFLLQSAGAIISKAWYIVCYEKLTKAGYKYGKDWTFLAHVHDEIQFAAKDSIAQNVAEIATASSKIAGDRLRMRIAIESEYKIGSNWAECH